MRKAVALLAAAFGLSAQEEILVAVQGKQVKCFFAASTQPAPALLLLPEAGGAEAARKCFTEWRPETVGRGWSLIVPELVFPPGSDDAVAAAQAVIRELENRISLDPARLYLAGRGDGASAALYIAARAPDLWAAALAIGGSPKPAIDSNRLFAGNTQLTPVLWIARDDPMRARLLEAGYNLERRFPPELTLREALDWLGAHRREPFPPRVDCETGSLLFARCYWVEITKLDPGRRNDVLPSTRVHPGSGAFLALGGFGYDPSLPGPGLVVGWLPENYKGPLRLGDRIVAVAGVQIADGRAYAEFMNRITEERPVAVMVLRGKERFRIETRIVLPKREETTTGRVQAEFLAEARELQIITRGVAELRLNLPAFWTPARITWNGLDAGSADAAGCWTLTDGGQARRCGR